MVRFWCEWWEGKFSHFLRFYPVEPLSFLWPVDVCPLIVSDKHSSLVVVPGLGGGSKYASFNVFADLMYGA